MTKKVDRVSRKKVLRLDMFGFLVFNQLFYMYWLEYQVMFQLFINVKMLAIGKCLISFHFQVKGII